MNFRKQTRFFLAAAVLSAAAAVHAQAGASAVDNPAAVPSSSRAHARTGGRRLALIVKQMSQDSGAKIECDSTVSTEAVAPPSEPTTSANFETQIDALISRLPKGTTWAKLYMPDLPTLSYKADSLADYAMAEASLFGTVGGALPQGTIEVLGQKLSAEKAASVASTLSLKPIYIITNTLARRQNPKMRAQALLAMTPDQREAAIGDMMSESADVMREMFSGMSPEERQATMAKGMKFTTVTPNGGQATVIIRSKDDGTPPPPPNP